ncbi:MAG: 6-phosphogluconolactonase [Pseudomonadota bacterium]
MSQFIQQFFDTRERAAIALADAIAAQLDAAITARGQATLVASGGSSPLAAFRALSARDIDWSKVTVLPSDERWVPETHDASNGGMLDRELRRNAAARAQRVSLFAEGLEGDEAVAAIDARLKALPRPFDVVLLGMGGDGHTASLFPDDPDIETQLASRDDVVFARPPSQGVARLSLTPRALLDARHIALLFFGQDKAAVFAQASAGGELAELPVRVVLRQQIVPVTTYHAL